MASKQTKRIFHHGKKVVISTSNKRAQTTVENNKKPSDDDDEQEGNAASNNVGTHQHNKRQKIQRPNAFLSFRINNPQIIDRAREAQEKIIESNPLLATARVPVPTFHITLMVFALKTEDDKQRAQQSLLEACHQINLEKLPTPNVSFSGLSHFNSKVLYIDPVKDIHLDSLTRIAEICRMICEKNGLVSTDTRPFNPHLTLFKLSKSRDLHRKGVKKIDLSWITSYENYHFGVESLRSIHLCNMLKKQADGYYQIFHEQYLFSTDLNSEVVQAADSSDQVICSADPVEVENERLMDETSINATTTMDETSALLPQHLTEQKETISARFNSVSRCCSCCSIL